MQTTSTLYNSLLADYKHWFEVSVVIGEDGVLIENSGSAITFGGYRVLVYNGAPNGGFRESQLYSVYTSDSVLDSTPAIGLCRSGEIEVKMAKPLSDIPKKSVIRPYIRVTNGTQTSEWIPKGVYYIDTREFTKNGTDDEVLTIHGYDRMITAEMDYPSDDTNTYPLLDKTMVQHIARNMKISDEDQGVKVDSDTLTLMNKGYTFGLPTGYSSREVLGYIASAYCGSFIIDELGHLKLVQFGSFPRESRYLIDELGNVITFGGTKILV